MNQQVHLKLFDSERAIQTAISMARRVGGLVQSDSEMPGFL